MKPVIVAVKPAEMKPVARKAEPPAEHEERPARRARLVATFGVTGSVMLSPRI